VDLKSPAWRLIAGGQELTIRLEVCAASHVDGRQPDKDFTRFCRQIPVLSATSLTSTPEAFEFGIACARSSEQLKTQK
jgi:hypothetical protein